MGVSTHFLDQIPPSACLFAPSSSHLRLRGIVIVVVTSLLWLPDSLIWKWLQLGPYPFGIAPSNLNKRDSFITHVSWSGSLLFRFQSFFVSCPNFVLQLAISFSGSFASYLGLQLATYYFVFRLFGGGLLPWSDVLLNTFLPKDSILDTRHYLFSTFRSSL